MKNVFKKRANAGPVACMTLLLSACTTVNFDQQLQQANQQAGLSQNELVLARTHQEQATRQELANQLLKAPLSENNAVRLTLVNSPALQALLAQNWSESAQIAQNGKLANPVLTFERLSSVSELEIGRMLSVGLLDLLTLPQRNRITKQQLNEQQLHLTRTVIEQVKQARQAWVQAVAAQQNQIYAQQVLEAAQASSELAERMKKAGNFNTLEQAKHQAFSAQANTQMRQAQQSNTSAKERLIRVLGLSNEQIPQLSLPDRLADLPKSPLQTHEINQAIHNNLDIQLAQAQYKAQAQQQGIQTITSFTDIELGIRKNTLTDRTTGTSSTKHGFEVNVTLPLFDWGGNQRDAMNAQTLMAANHLEATVRSTASTLRENYAAYLTAFDVSQQYRDEIVPLRKTISQENMLRYNGMLIGVFELLEDTQDQIKSVMQAIEAQEQFWLADAALQASLLGTTPRSTP